MSESESGPTRCATSPSAPERGLPVRPRMHGMVTVRSTTRAPQAAGVFLLGLVMSVALAMSDTVARGQAPSAEPAIADGAWASVAAMPGARAEVVAAKLDGGIVVVGGLDEDGTSLDTVERYDPVADAWARLASLPEPRDHAAMAAWDGQLYVSGGGEFVRRTAGANLWAYDQDRDIWRSLASMPQPRWQHAMVALDGVLYVIGGIIEGSGDHADVWAYDIAADGWRTDLAPLPTPREHLAAVVADGRIVVLAGRLGPNFASVEIYDPRTDSWSRAPDMPNPRSGFAAAVLPDGVHVTGGEDFGSGRTIGTHERLDLERMEWSSLPKLPTPRHGTGSAVVDGRWYVVGGGPSVGLSTSDAVEVWTGSAN